MELLIYIYPEKCKIQLLAPSSDRRGKCLLIVLSEGKVVDFVKAQSYMTKLLYSILDMAAVNKQAH
jgi:hypothetical protein